MCELETGKILCPTNILSIEVFFFEVERPRCALPCQMRLGQTTAPLLIRFEKKKEVVYWT